MTKNINLLKDTKQPDDGLNGRRLGAGGFDLSSPERYEFKEKEGKAVSGASSWFSRMFKGSPKKQKKPPVAGIHLPTETAPSPNVRYVRTQQDVVDQPPAAAVPTNPPFARQPQAPLPEPSRPPQPHFSLPNNAMVPPRPDAHNRTSAPVPPLPPSPPLPPRGPQFSSQRPVSFDVNLLPEDLVDQYEPRKKLINLAIISGLTIVGLAAIYVVMLFYQSSIVTRTNEVRTEASSVNQQISSHQKQRTAALALKEKIDAIGDRLDQHIYWSKFFTLLEKHTVPDVYYSNVFAGDINGELVLEATGKDYSSVARQLLAFQQATDFVDSVVINSASRTTETEGSQDINFSIQVKLVEDVFIKTDAEAGQ